MSKEKKTMYEILGVPQNASDSEIQDAYLRMTQDLQSKRNETNREDIDLKLKVINVAFGSLSTKRTRDAYDARLARDNSTENVAASLSLVPITPNTEPLALKVEAVSLKAEAMSLKAEAVSLRAEVIALRAGAGTSSPDESVIQKTSRFFTPVKNAFTIVGTLIAIWMVVQVLFLLFSNSDGGPVLRANSKAQEEVMLQDYFQRTGVRVNSKAEMDMLEAEERRAEKEQRELKEQERAQQEVERKYQRFVDDSRHEGEQVSNNLRLAEEAEEQRARWQEQEKRRQEQEEYERIEREKERWRRTLLN